MIITINSKEPFTMYFKSYLYKINCLSHI